MEIVRDAFRRTRASDLDTALAMLAPLFEGDVFAEFRRESLNYRSIVLEWLGRFDDALADLRAAHALCEAPSNSRYALELAIATDARRRGDADEELTWNRRALATAAADPTIAGYGAALDVLERAGEAGLSAEDRDHTVATIKQGWTILGLDGEPDLSDLHGALQRMLQRGGDRDYWAQRS